MIRIIDSLEIKIRRTLLSRRRVLGAVAAFFLTIVLKPFHNALASSHKAISRRVFDGKLLKENFRFFTPYQATVVNEITALIIPSDECPGAREAGVVFKLDKDLSYIERSRNLYMKGVQWIDHMSHEVYKKESFLDLDDEGKRALLQMAESGKSIVMDTGRARPGYVSAQMAQSFFMVVKRETFEAFYTSAEGWECVGYQGPPQWRGNRDYQRCVQPDNTTLK